MKLTTFLILTFGVSATLISALPAPLPVAKTVAQLADTISHSHDGTDSISPPSSPPSHHAKRQKIQHWPFAVPDRKNGWKRSDAHVPDTDLAQKRGVFDVLAQGIQALPPMRISPTAMSTSPTASDFRPNQKRGWKAHYHGDSKTGIAALGREQAY